jgi:hypothetical protein
MFPTGGRLAKVAGLWLAGEHNRCRDFYAAATTAPPQQQQDALGEVVADMAVCLGICDLHTMHAIASLWAVPWEPTSDATHDSLMLQILFARLQEIHCIRGVDLSAFLPRLIELAFAYRTNGLYQVQFQVPVPTTMALARRFSLPSAPDFTHPLILALYHRNLSLLVPYRSKQMQLEPLVQDFRHTDAFLHLLHLHSFPEVPMRGMIGRVLTAESKQLATRFMLAFQALLISRRHLMQSDSFAPLSFVPPLKARDVELRIGLVYRDDVAEADGKSTSSSQIPIV